MDDTATNVPCDAESFAASWPGVLAEMKDFIDLWFLAGGTRREATAVRVFISRTLVPQSRLQPHVREFRAALARIPHCRVELKSTELAAHRIEIEYRR
jgi:hypothetical protein